MTSPPIDIYLNSNSQRNPPDSPTAPTSMNSTNDHHYKTITRLKIQTSDTPVLLLAQFVEACMFVSFAVVPHFWLI